MEQTVRHNAESCVGEKRQSQEKVRGRCTDGGRGGMRTGGMNPVSLSGHSTDRGQPVLELVNRLSIAIVKKGTNG